MEGLVKLMGIVMVVAGAIYFVKPNTMKKLANYFLQEKRLKVGGVIAIVIGIVFLLAASQCAIPWLVILFGILALAEGIAVFALGQKKFKSMVDALTERPPKTLRGYALIKILLGVILIYSV